VPVAVIAIDISPIRLACAAHNAEIYGVADRIQFVLADVKNWTAAYLADPDRIPIDAV
jgi:trimethylguanosine synthase